MSAQHTYERVNVPVAGGDLAVGVWTPTADYTTTIIAIHGVTSSHLAWSAVVAELGDVRIIAPDLRGRGRSNSVAGGAGMTSHADDIVAVLDRFGLDRAVLVGHSMGGFVSMVTAFRYPERVASMLLVDGGLPLAVPAGLSADELISHILGPTAARLGMRFADAHAYFEFWKQHPAFRTSWNEEIEAYFAYDLVPDGEGALRPATSYDVVAVDTVDLNTGQLPQQATQGRTVPATFVSVPRGLQDETPGLYPPAHLAMLRTECPDVVFHHLDDLNHYTVVMSPEGAAQIAPFIRAALAVQPH